MSPEPWQFQNGCQAIGDAITIVRFGLIAGIPNALDGMRMVIIHGNRVEGGRTEILVDLAEMRDAELGASGRRVMLVNDWPREKETVDPLTTGILLAGDALRGSR